MKKVTIMLLASIIACSAFCQRTAAFCGNGCYVITATVKNDHACGGDYDYTYTIKNNSYNTVDIKMFVEKRNGEWVDLGIVENVESGRELKDAFWSCDLSGRYILYYRTSGSGDRFPTSNEINNRY
jgi:hypothetical protein